MNFPQRLNGRLVLKKREIRSKRGRFLGAISDACKTLSKKNLTTVFKLADTFISIRYKLNNI